MSCFVFFRSSWNPPDFKLLLTQLIETEGIQPVSPHKNALFLTEKVILMAVELCSP